MTCQIEAKVLQRSVGADAPPLTSFQLRYPLIIHAELMTHRVFSRNARSSRAVPTARLVEEVKNAPFIPRYWGANQKGMQAGEEHDEQVYSSQAPTGRTRWVSRERAWLDARDHAVQAAEAFAEAGYHKQIANRLLGPFLHIDVVLSTTQLSNWDALRDHEAAEPHIRDLARAMKDAVAEWDACFGGPLLLEPGEWHTPYVTQGVRQALSLATVEGAIPHDFGNPDTAAIAVSVTRCAQVSYTPFHEAKLTFAEEIARHDRLVTAQPMHASPAEHQATPDRIVGHDDDGEPIWANPKLHGNLRGWIQYRKTLAGEAA